MTPSVDATDASMDVADRPLDRPSPEPTGPARSTRLTPPEIAAAICPYLVSAEGSWRQASASRDHRCAAVVPIASLPTDKQRRHCLSAEHEACSTFRAARASRAALLAPGIDPAHVAATDAARRPVARTAPVVLEPPRLIDQAVRFQFERTPGQIALIALMAIAFLVVAVARLSAGTQTTPDPSVGPSAPVITIPAASPSAAPTPSRSAGPSAGASGPATRPSPGASDSSATYTVKKGDTLSGIAGAHGTTAAEIQMLNDMKDTNLKIGQVLKLP
jgi:LysM repeat protein